MNPLLKRTSHDTNPITPIQYPNSSQNRVRDVLFLSWYQCDGHVWVSQYCVMEWYKARCGLWSVNRICLQAYLCGWYQQRLCRQWRKFVVRQQRSNEEKCVMCDCEIWFPWMWKMFINNRESKNPHVLSVPKYGSSVTSLIWDWRKFPWIKRPLPDIPCT